MTMWFVDCGPLGHLAAVARPAWSWPVATIHITREVAREAAAAGHKNQQLLSQQRDNQPWISVHDIAADSKAATIFARHLRPRQANATRNVGEDTSIALLAAEWPEAVFVTADKSATFVALAELGVGRVASPFCLYDDLRNRKLITEVDFDDLCRRNARQLRQTVPGVPWRFKPAQLG